MSRNHLFSKKKTATDPIVFDQYQMYVQSAEKISDRRQAANNFVWTIHGAFISAFGLASSFPDNRYRVLQTLIAIQAFFLCWVWRKLISSYRQLNTGKFAVIHEFEEKLPAAPYSYEWYFVGEGKDQKKYGPFSHIELIVPIIFAAFWAAAIILIFRQEIGSFFLRTSAFCVKAK